eukprot:3802504-Rhodomonas_salina.2
MTSVYEPGSASSTNEQKRSRKRRPVAPPTAAPATVVLTPAPAIAVDWRVANMLPFATTGMVDCQAAAMLPFDTPMGQKPADPHSIAGVIVYATAPPIAALDVSRTAAHLAEIFTSLSSVVLSSACD